MRLHAAGAADPDGESSPRRGVTKQENVTPGDGSAEFKQDSEPDGRASSDSVQPSRLTAGSGANIPSSQAVRNTNSAPELKEPSSRGATRKSVQSANSVVSDSSVSSSNRANRFGADISDDDAFESPVANGLGTMDINTISKLILTASSSAGSEDLADFIMKVSKSSSSSTEMDGSTSSQEARKMAPLPKDSASSVTKDVSSADREQFDRQPDGKSQSGNIQKVVPSKLTGSGSRSGSVDSINKIRSGSIENIPSKTRSHDTSLLSTHDERESLRRKSAEGRAEEDSSSSYNKKFKGSRIPTFGGRKHPKSSAGSDRLVTGSSDLDASVHKDDKNKESRKEGKLPVGKVEPMPSSERDDSNLENSRWKSPRRSSIMPRTTREEDPGPAASRLDLNVVYGERNQDVRITDGLSTSQHERERLQTQATQDRSAHVPVNSTPAEILQNEARNNHSPTQRSGNTSPGDGIGEEDQITPQEHPPDVPRKTRFSSTPLNPDATNDVTLTASAVSRISPSPADRRTYIPSSTESESLTPEKDRRMPNAVQRDTRINQSTNDAICYSADHLHHQSTPKGAKSKPMKPRNIQHNDTEDLNRVRDIGDELRNLHTSKVKTRSAPAPLDSWKPEHSANYPSLPHNIHLNSTNVTTTTTTTIPTLLTNQSLAKTTFASQYLSTSGTGLVRGTQSALPGFSTSQSELVSNRSPYQSSSLPGRMPVSSMGMSNRTPVSAGAGSRLSMGLSPMDQHSQLSSYSISPSTFATMSYGTLLTTSMSVLGDPEVSRQPGGGFHGHLAEVGARLPFSESVRSGENCHNFLKDLIEFNPNFVNMSFTNSD